MTQCKDGEEHRVRWIRRLTGAFFLLLLGATWPLWAPHGSVPQVPAVAGLAGIPFAVDWIGLAIVVSAGAAWAFFDRLTELAALALFCSLSLLLVLDQLRWQPWAIQSLLFVAVIALANPSQAMRLLQWLTIGIYFHAAIAKLDRVFAHTVGQQFLATVVSGIGGDVEAIPAETRLWLSMGFPLAELVVAAMLCFRRTVRAGVVGAVAMHLSTIAILGPWGLGHQWGVLIWNLWLALQAPVLFWPLRGSPTTGRTGFRYRSNAATALVLLAVLFPFGTRWGIWDTWPSWGLYAPGAERATVWVHELGVARLSPNLRAHVLGNETWRQLRLDRWVLSHRHAPIYPQSRIQLALAKSLADRYQLGDLIRIELASPAERWTGQRVTNTLDNGQEIDAAAARYWLNASATRWPTNGD